MLSAHRRGDSLQRLVEIQSNSFTRTTGIGRLRGERPSGSSTAPGGAGMRPASNVASRVHPGIEPRLKLRQHSLRPWVADEVVRFVRVEDQVEERLWSGAIPAHPCSSQSDLLGLSSQLGRTGPVRRRSGGCTSQRLVRIARIGS